MNPIVDKNNEVLKIGDWVQFSPSPTYFGEIIEYSLREPGFIINFFNVGHCNYDQATIAICMEKITREEAFIRILENS